MQANQTLVKFSPKGKIAQTQFKTLSQVNQALDNIFERLNRIEAEARTRRHELLSIYTMPELAQLAADNSNPRTGDRFVLRFVVDEIGDREVQNGA